MRCLSRLSVLELEMLAAQAGGPGFFEVGLVGSAAPIPAELSFYFVATERRWQTLLHRVRNGWTHVYAVRRTISPLLKPF